VLGGVDRGEEVRARLGVLLDEMLTTGQSFQRNIRDDVRRIEVEPADLIGLPEDFLRAHPATESGKVVLDTNYPDFFPIQTYAERTEVREALMRAFASRGHPANEVVLKRLLELRHEYATRLGHRSWAELQAKDKMVGSAARIRSFTEEVAELARPRMLRDLEALLAEKQRRETTAERIEKWDRFFYLKEVQKRSHRFDPAEARAYLGYEGVLAGAFDIFGELFELEFVPIDRPVWHPSVETFELRLRGETVGRFYLDMFPREGKYGHAAMFPVTVGRRGAELSEAALVCNFPDPSLGPALLEHSQVVTFFHELGHLIHHLLARDSRFVNQAGISTEWDFVEAPSQLLEEWAFDAAVLSRFARHHETGALMPPELIEGMRASRDFGLGLHVMRQLFYQALSLDLHDQSPEGVDLESSSHALEARYAPYPPMPGTHEYANFGHLEGYSSMYYTYQWSMALAKDLLTGFSKDGLLSGPVARAYRDRVLTAGGTKPAAELVADFLGRAYNLDAYRAWLAGPEPSSP
jgi:thimet oligopeptidase